VLFCTELEYPPLNSALHASSPPSQGEQGKIGPGILTGLKIDLRGVLVRNVMVDTQLWEILQQSWMLERLAVHQVQGNTFCFFTRTKARVFGLI
jgi:hypothetical protein